MANLREHTKLRRFGKIHTLEMSTLNHPLPSDGATVINNSADYEIKYVFDNTIKLLNN